MVSVPDAFANKYWYETLQYVIFPVQMLGKSLMLMSVTVCCLAVVERIIRLTSVQTSCLAFFFATSSHRLSAAELSVLHCSVLLAQSGCCSSTRGPSYFSRTSALASSACSRASRPGTSDPSKMRSDGRWWRLSSPAGCRCPFWPGSWRSL